MGLKLADVRILRLSKSRGLEEQTRDDVGVHVGGGAAVLEIAATLVLGLVRDAHGGAAVSDAVFEFIDGAGFVKTGETKLVVFAVGRDVLLVGRGEAFNLIQNQDFGRRKIGILTRKCRFRGFRCWRCQIFMSQIEIRKELEKTILILIS